MAAAVPAVLSTFQAERMGMARSKEVPIPTELAPFAQGFLGSSTVMSAALSLITPNYKESWETLLPAWVQYPLNKSGVSVKQEGNNEYLAASRFRHIQWPSNKLHFPSSLFGMDSKMYKPKRLERH